MPIEFVCLRIIDACSEHCMSNAIEFTARAAAVMPNFGIIDACSEHCMSNAFEFTTRAVAVMPNFGLFCVVEVPNVRFNYK